jgi:hypothetical protein
MINPVAKAEPSVKMSNAQSIWFILRRGTLSIWTKSGCGAFA